jgi:TM2 domain-containing membrane protein YozV
MKNRKIAALLAIFLGGLGAHKFYMGNYQMGILYLIFSITSIPSMIGIIEGINLLIQTDYEFDHPDVIITINEKLFHIVENINSYLLFTMIMMFLSGGIPGIPFWVLRHKFKKHIKNKTNPVKPVKFVFVVNVIFLVPILIGLFGFAIFSEESREFPLAAFLMIGIFMLFFGIPFIQSYKFLKAYRDLVKENYENVSVELEV